MKWSVHFVQFDRAHWPFVIVMTLAFFVRILFSSAKSSVAHHKPEETLEDLIEASRRLRTLRKRPILGIGGCPVSHFQAQAIQRGNITDSLQYFIFCSAGLNSFRVCLVYELPSCSTMHATDKPCRFHTSVLLILYSAHFACSPCWEPRRQNAKS